MDRFDGLSLALYGIDSRGILPENGLAESLPISIAAEG